MSASDPQSLLKNLRASIDNIDAALVHMLAERFRCTQAVGELKATHGLPPADPNREKQQIERLRRLADDAQLDPDFAEKFLNFIIREVIRHHEAIAASNGNGGAGEIRRNRIDTETSDGLDKGPILGSDDPLPTQMG